MKVRRGDAESEEDADSLLIRRGEEAKMREEQRQAPRAAVLPWPSVVVLPGGWAWLLRSVGVSAPALLFDGAGAVHQATASESWCCEPAACDLLDRAGPPSACRSEHRIDEALIGGPLATRA